MRIATYNIWNSLDGMPSRERHIVEEINKIKADILCLQEVRDEMIAAYIAENCSYTFILFDSFSGEDEGLAILGKFPFVQSISLLKKTNAIAVQVEVCGKRLCIINIHLPWDSPRKREQQIIDTISFIDHEPFDYAFLAGDFNCSETSDVNRFLIGECLLQGKEAKPDWFDLASAYAEQTQTQTQPDFTLNFRENPRFVDNTIEINSRSDRIMLRNAYPLEFPKLADCHIFGQKIYSETKLAASDHYGVVAEVLFCK